MAKLVVAFSGKKQSGKSSACNFITAEIINTKIGAKRFSLDENGNLLDTFNNKIVKIHIPVDNDSKAIFNSYGIKIYSLADPLKEFVANTFGIDINLLYGTDADKNLKTHICWDDMPPHIRVEYSQKRRGSKEHMMAIGPMTIREILQVFGTDICRQMDANCWARALYNKIKLEDYPVNIISDARFPNEISIGTEMGVKVVRLLRKAGKDDTHISETALDDFPLGEYSLVVDNSNLSMDEKHNLVFKQFLKWINDHKIKI